MSWGRGGRKGGERGGEEGRGEREGREGEARGRRGGREREEKTNFLDKSSTRGDDGSDSKISEIFFEAQNLEIKVSRAS
jgi:hypothetical protein